MLVKGVRQRWIPPTKASDAELWCFLWFAPEQTEFETSSRSLWRHCNEGFKSVLTESNFQIWLLIGWKHSHQPIRCQVKRCPFTRWGFNRLNIIYMYIILFSMQQIGVESMPFSGLFNTCSPLSRFIDIFHRNEVECCSNGDNEYVYCTPLRMNYSTRKLLRFILDILRMKHSWSYMYINISHCETCTMTNATWYTLMPVWVKVSGV